MKNLFFLIVIWWSALSCYKSIFGFARIYSIIVKCIRYWDLDDLELIICFAHSCRVQIFTEREITFGKIKITVNSKQIYMFDTVIFYNWLLYIYISFNYSQYYCSIDRNAFIKFDFLFFSCLFIALQRRYLNFFIVENYQRIFLLCLVCNAKISIWSLILLCIM